MLHVLLTILKVIGIILLVLLGIILLLILLVLFVPFRYRIHVRKDQDIFEANGRLTWLLHLLRVDIIYVKKRGIAVIKVFGLKIKTLHFLGKDDEEGDSGGERSDGGPASGDTADENVRTEIESKDSALTEDAVDENSSAQIEAELTQDESHHPDNTAEKEDVKHEDTSEGLSKTKKVHAHKEEHSDKIDKILGLVDKLLNLVLKLLNLPYDLYDKIDIITDRISAKVEAIRKKVSPFLSIEGEHMIGKLIRYLKYLIRGYAPRKISGYLRFGAGSPDTTGKIAGLIYVLLPESGNGYSVEPDFYESKLETDTTASGHIRVSRLAWVAIRLLVDKEFWRLLAKIRGKDRSGKKKKGRKQKTKE